ncbi:MAG TPA: phage holin family protein [Verrucomicrobiae bacterium]|jgi:uncharacterized membrane protein YqjE
METPADSFPHLADVSKRLTQRAMVIGENRIELLMVEIQEERERILRAILLALSAAVFGLLAGLAFTAVMVVFFWQTSPLAVLALLTILYGGVAVGLYRRLVRLQHDWQMLPATIDQLRKDCECLGKQLN